MSPIDGRARILQFLEVDDDLVQRDTSKVRHGSPPRAPLSWKPHRGRYTQKPAGAQALQLTRITYKCALALHLAYLTPLGPPSHLPPFAMWRLSRPSGKVAGDSCLSPAP